MLVCRLVHLDVEDCSEELLRQQSYAIKNKLGHPKPPTRGFGTQYTPIGGAYNRNFLCMEATYHYAMP